MVKTVIIRKRTIFIYGLLVLVLAIGVVVLETFINKSNNDEYITYAQAAKMIPILNVVENITLPCRLDGKEVKEERLEELLEILNLKNRKEHLPNQLSGGQQQRVSIGRAIVNYPAIVLADEPTGNLDSKASREIIDLLKMSNQKYNQTVILITHDENVALEADRILTIDDGKIVKDERVR